MINFSLAEILQMAYCLLNVFSLLLGDFVLVPPSIALGPTNITVTVNIQTTLACEATGIPKPSVNWRKNGHLLNVDQNQNSYR